MTAAAFRASYADFKLIKSRGVIQIVFEVPLHASDEAYGVVGGMPDPAKERWFAIARLAPEGASQPRPAEQPTKPAGAKSYAQRIALLCKEPKFWKFLEEKYRPMKVWDEEAAAETVRMACDVISRGDIIEGSGAAEKWRQLSADYAAWERVPA